MSSQTIMIALLVLLQTLGFDAGISGFLQRYLFELPNSRTQELEGKVHYVIDIADYLTKSTCSRFDWPDLDVPRLL